MDKRGECERGAKLAGRLRPLRSRNDIKVFREPRTRVQTPFKPPLRSNTITTTSPILSLITRPSFSVPPAPRLGLLFIGGGFQGCGVPINNSLSHSLYLFLSRSLCLCFTFPPLTVPSTITRKARVRIRQKCVPLSCTQSFNLPTSAGERSLQNGDAPLLLYTSTKVKCDLCVCL